MDPTFSSSIPFFITSTASKWVLCLLSRSVTGVKCHRLNKDDSSWSSFIVGRENKFLPLCSNQIHNRPAKIIFRVCEFLTCENIVRSRLKKRSHYLFAHSTKSICENCISMLNTPTLLSVIVYIIWNFNPASAATFYDCQNAPLFVQPFSTRVCWPLVSAADPSTDYWPSVKILNGKGICSGALLAQPGFSFDKGPFYVVTNGHCIIPQVFTYKSHSRGGIFVNLVDFSIRVSFHDNFDNPLKQTFGIKKARK